METPDAALTDRWGLLLATMVGNGAGLAALPFFALSSFMVPLKAAFGWPRGDVGLAATILAGGVFLTAAMTGRLCDRFGARRVAIWSVGLYAMDLATMAADGPWIGWFYGQFAVLALVGGGTTSVAYSRMIAASFRRRRGLALGIMASGGGVTALLLPMLLNRVIEDHGWRAGWLVCAGIALLPLPLLLALGQERAASSVSAPDRQPGLSMGEALRTRAFWLLGGAIALSISAASGLVVHLKPMLLDLGLAPLSAARIAGLLGLGILVGRLGTGYLLDRIDGSKLAACVMLAATLGFMLLAGQLATTAFAGVLLVGCTIGAEGDLLAFLTANRFGLRNYAEIFGWLFGVMSLGSATGPVLVGRLYHVGGGYGRVLWLFAAQSLLAGLAFLLVRRPGLRRGHPGPSAEASEVR